MADSAFSAMPVIFNAFAQAAKIDREKVKWVAAESSALPSLLATGRVEAVGQFTVGEPLLAATVAPKTLVRIAYKDAGLDYYGNGMSPLRKRSRKPGDAQGVRPRDPKGHADAFANPKEAGVILNKYQKQISPRLPKAKPSWSASLRSFPARRWASSTRAASSGRSTSWPSHIR